MDITLAHRRVHDARIARLATVTPESRPHVVPCCFALVDETAYTAVDAKPKSTLELRRLRNMRANPATSVLVDHYDEDWTLLWWIRLDGTARVVQSAAEAQHATSALTSKYDQYTHVAIPGPIIAVEISSWVTWP